MQAMKGSPDRPSSQAIARLGDVWLHPALSRQARSAREEAEVNATWQLVSGIAADW
jgi:hypothetical protein